MSEPVRSGLDVLLSDGAARLAGQRVALLCNHTAVDVSLRHAIDRLVAAGVDLVRLFGPEHGVRATAQDMVGVDEARDPVSGLPVVSLYGATEASLRPRPGDLDGVDVVVVDIQDIGARYYTYAATMGFVMEAAASAGVAVLVLDRPNPIGGLRVEGEAVRPGFDSFVGAYPLPVRHGMTLGEIATWLVQVQGVACALEVVRCEGWRRDAWFDDTGLPWVYPSPNMPTVDTALVYPGMCLFEATTLSEGRGTTRPFHLVGAPWLDPNRFVALAERVAADAGLRGVGFRPAAFRPGFQKHAGVDCRGLEVHVRDRDAVDAYRLGLVVLDAAWRADPAAFGWRPDPYEFVTDRAAIDLLTGCTRVRERLEGGGAAWTALDAEAPGRDAFLAVRESVLLYR